MTDSYETTPGGIVYPTQPKQYPKVFTFEVYYYSDLIKFLEILQDREWNSLLSVTKNWYDSGLSAGWVIVYRAPDPIEMEVLC